MKAINLTKNIIVKTLSLSLIFISLVFFYSCEEFDEFGYEDDNPTEELNGNGSIIPGLYKKQVSQTAAYLKITASQGYLCRAQDNIEFSGSLVGNTVHFEVDGSIIETELRQEGNNLWARNLINNSYDEWTEYFPSNDNYPCNGGGNNFDLNGQWLTSDGLGINIINNSYAFFTSYSANWQIIYNNNLINSSTLKLKLISPTSNSLRWDCEDLWWAENNDNYAITYSNIGQILMSNDGASITISSIVNMPDFGLGDSGTRSESHVYYRN